MRKPRAQALKVAAPQVGRQEVPRVVPRVVRLAVRPVVQPAEALQAVPQAVQQEPRALLEQRGPQAR